MTLIQVDNLSFAYGKKMILKGISLKINAGEILTIIGPNGSGKTSLLRILAGLTAAKIKCKKGLKIAYMPQNINFDAMLPITVRGFLSLMNNANLVQNMAEEVGIEGILDQQIHQISGGEQQRVLIANCLLINPQLMVLDEPVSNMDIKSAKSFYHLISEFRSKTGCSIVMTSHDLYVVMKNTDRVICLNNKIHCEGKPHEVYATEEFIDLFGEEVALYGHDHTEQ